MLDRRSKNVEVFEDTMDMINEEKYILKAFVESIKTQKLYLEKDEVELPEGRGFTCQIVVSTKRSFEAAATYAREGKKVCVLNFASATNPGGGVTRGSSAQEECLCRCSTLYPCLDDEHLWDKFYTPHREAGNPLYNDDCVYTPGVMVIKSDTDFPERMDSKDWYTVDVLTCAAPNLRNIPSNNMNPFAGEAPAKIEIDGLYELHLQRIERIFQVAAANGADVLILGAFGCGAFKNPPEIVAKAFKVVAEKYASYFETIEYAVFCGGHEMKNYDAFCEVYGLSKKYDLSRFLNAHNDHYEDALTEVKAGQKRSHWMWFIFPQIKGLGHSRTSLFYAISSLGEAKDYMADEVLGAHMTELCETLLTLETNNPSEVFGWPDDMKLKSSMTLFEVACPEKEIFGKVLDKYYKGERCQRTLDILRNLK